MIYFFKNNLLLKVVIIFLIIFVIFQNYKVPKNLHTILKNNYDTRISNSYSYCGDESIGFLNYIKKKYKIKNNIEIKQYFISPHPSWFFFNIKKQSNFNKKKILLGYNEFEILNFKLSSNEFVSTSDIKDLNNVYKISFELNKKKNFENQKIEIFSEAFGTRQKILEKEVSKFSKGENELLLKENINDYYKNSKIIILFNPMSPSEISFIKNLIFFKKNSVNLENYNILEKFNNCYFISKK